MFQILEKNGSPMPCACPLYSLPGSLWFV